MVEQEQYPGRGYGTPGFYESEDGREALTELDIGVNYLGDPWGFSKLEPWQKADMLAYYYIQHGTSDTKSALSAPLTYTDMLSGKLLDRGIDPKTLSKGSSSSVMPVRNTTPVKVYGGSSTPQIENMAMLWAKKSAPKHIQKKTGATTDAMDFWFQGD